MALKKLTAAVSMCLAALVSTSVAAAPDPTLSITGDGSTNSLNATTTLGSVELKVKGNGPGSSSVKLVCGILGQLQSQLSPVTLQFQHTVVCDDHSVFVLSTTTTITPQSFCPTGGVVGTFTETSNLTGIAGPFAGVTGTLNTTGTLNCGFNELTITGTATRP
jgi:hypothetical protein